MRYLSILFISICFLTGCVGNLSDRSTSVDAGVDIDVYPVTRTLQVKIEKNRADVAYDKVLSYISQYRTSIFNGEVSLLSSTKKGNKLLKRVEKYLKQEGMDLDKLQVVQQDNERFDFVVEVLEYRVQVPLCKKPALYYSYEDSGCAVEANLWHSKVNPQHSLRKQEQ